MGSSLKGGDLPLIGSLPHHFMTKRVGETGPNEKLYWNDKTSDRSETGQRGEKEVRREKRHNVGKNSVIQEGLTLRGAMRAPTMANYD